MKLYIHDWKTFTNVGEVEVANEAEARTVFQRVATPGLIISTNPDPRPLLEKHVSMCTLYDLRFGHNRVYVSTPKCGTGYWQSNLYAGRLEEAIDLALAAINSGYGPIV